MLLSYAIAHFSLGAMISLILFRIFSKKTNDYIRYDIIVASLGGLWAMIPDFPYIFGNFRPLCKGSLCNIFFFHCILDKYDPNDTPIFSALMFGLFLLVLNLITLKTLKNKS